MKLPEITSSDDVRGFLRMHLASAALGTALELKLFWLLDEEPMNTEEISIKLKIPYDRMYSWLELLVGLGFLNREHDSYSPSSITRSTILDTFKPDSWAFLALEARDRYTLGTNLSSNIFLPHSIWNALPESSPNWFEKISSDMDYCRRFTRMLYDLHQDLALKLSEILDLTDKTKLMDIGGGSGVISLALLRKNSKLKSVVVDIPSVCQIGQEIVKENEMSHRITYYPANFIIDDIPSGFDIIIECDVGVYTKSLFQKIFTSLDPDGEFIIVANIDADSAQIIKSDSSKPLPLLLSTFQSSLETQKLSERSIDEILHLLSETGFSIIPQDEKLEHMTLIRAKKGK